MAELATLPALSTLPTESSFSALSTESSSSQVASLSSTPPTSVSPDSVSLASDHDTPKPANTTTPLLEGSRLLQEQQQCLPQEVEREQHVEEHGPSIAVQTLSEPTLQVKTEPEPELETRPELEPELDAGQQTPIAQAIIVAAQALTAPEPPSTGRSRRARGAAPPVYNLAKLSGTDIHGKRRANGDPVQERRRRTTTGNTLTGADALVRNGINALDLDWEIRGPSTPRSARTARKVKSSPKDELPARRPTRLSGAAVTGTLTAKMSALGKRSRKTFEKGLSRLSRELARLQDTDEFSHVDKRPVVHTVWSNGKFVDPREIEAEAAAPPPRKKAKTASSPEPEKKQEVAEKQEEGTKAGPAQTKGHVKKWLDKGLYAGQEAPADVFKGLTAQEKKKLAQIPELASGTKPNRSLPMPMFGGLRLLLTGRDFKLPYDVCNPLPPGQPKPTAYRTMTRSEPPFLFCLRYFLPLHNGCMLTRDTQIGSLAMLPRTGRSSRTSTTSSPSASASPRMAVTTSARTASCCMSAMIRTATLAGPTAPIAPSRACRRGPSRGAGSASASRSSRRAIEDTESGATAASSPTRSSWNTLVRSLPRRSASGG